MATNFAFPPRLQFSGHETFPLRQLWLRKAYLAVAATAGDPIAAKQLFNDEAAIRRFGVGKNMVAAIRHWALATDVIVESSGGVPEPGSIGNFLFGPQAADPFLERPATAWLVHWFLAGKASRSTTWYWIFNRVTSQTFDRAAVVAGIEQLAVQKQSRASETTLKRDVEVCIRCYLSRQDGREADDAAEPLLADLGLLSEGPAGTFQFRRGAQTTLPDGVFAYALFDFWKRWEEATGGAQGTLSFEAIAHDFGSPGRVFKLDENSVAERLMNLEALTDGKVRWMDTAGVRQISRHESALSEKFLTQLLKKAYGR